jgi:hypothetical protein
MSRVFDRAYMQSLAGFRKRQQIDYIINMYQQAIEDAAKNGKPSYLVDMQGRHMQPTNIKGQEPILPPTPEELIEAFQKKYPGCDVSYKEEWIDTDASTRVLKKGILIDWS